MSQFKMQDGESLYVRIIGQGEPVLILSGLGMSSWQWLPYIYSNLKTRQFIIPDYRGFGGSKHCKVPEHLNAIESHWHDINQIIQKLHIKEIDVIGYSMGATTTLHGLKYGNFSNHIKRYLHIDQTAKIKNDEQWKFGLFGQKQDSFLALLQEIIELIQPYQNQFQNISQLPQNIQKQLSKLWLQFLTLQKPKSRLPHLINKFPVHKIHIHLLPMQSLAYILWYLETYLDHKEDYRDALIQLEKPAHFIIGKQSTLYPYQGQLLLAKQLKNSKYDLMKGSGHMPLLNQPLEFKKRLNQFLQSQ